MSLIDTVNQSYKSAARVSVYVEFAEPGGVATIAQAQSELFKLIAQGDEDLQSAADILRKLRFRLATNVLPPGDPALGIAELSEELAAQAAELSPDSRAGATVDGALEATALLLAEPESQLGAAAVGVLGTERPDRRMLVLRYPRRVAATQQYLRDAGVPTVVCSRSEVRRQEQMGSMVLIGDPQFYQASTWTAARAESVCFVQYPLAHKPVPEGGLFGKAGGLQTPVFRLSGSIEPIPRVEFFDPDVVVVEAGQREAERRRSDRPDAVEAALLLLDADHQVWTAVGDGRFMWALDLENPSDPTVSPVSTDNVRAESFVIFRDEGAAGSLIQAIADRDFGASAHREAQSEWKQALTSAIHRAGGFADARRKMLSLGASSPNPRGWSAPESIRPNSRSDFGVACKFAGLADKADELWSALSEIKSAHSRAGVWVRERLLESLVAEQLDQLQDDGFLSLDLPGLGRLSVYRVLHVHPETVSVDPALIDQPFTREL